ncbi:MAG: hypothetical protein ACYDC2_01520 [Solirubrobacteraceae bacterium]
MSGPIAFFRRRYGASPLHLLAFIAGIAVTGLAVKGWLDEPAISIRYILIWFVGAIVAHDMIVVPLYSALDRLMLASSRRSGRRPAAAAPSEQRGGEPAPLRSPGWVYVRVPLILSALLALVFGAEILGEGTATFRLASGHSQDVYLSRYLIVVGALFLLSGLAYLRSSARASSRMP